MRKKILEILGVISLLSSCNNIDEGSINSSSSLSELEESVSSFEESSVDQSVLKEKKNDAIAEIYSFLNQSLYDDAEKDEINDLIVKCVFDIGKCKTIEAIDSVLNSYEDSLLNVKTIKQKEIEELKNEKELLSMYTSTKQIDEYEAKGYNYLYQDPTFQNGFRVTKNSTEGNPYHDEILRYYNSVSKTNSWTIGQWATKYDLLDTSSLGGYSLIRSEDGLVNSIISKGKDVDGSFVPGKILKLNSKTGSIYLECNTSVEYDKPRSGVESWVHLLLEQDFSNNLVQLSSCSSIVMDAKFTVNKCVNHLGSSYNTSIHAAQVVWYLTLQNRNQNSEGYGKYIWFGISLWDNRNEGKKSSAYIAHDAGTDTLIYNPASNVYYADSLGVLPKINEEAHANVDILSIAKLAFETGKRKGYLTNTNWEDLYIGGTNFGYEVPGTFDIATTFECINVFYK